MGGSAASVREGFWRLGKNSLLGKDILLKGKSSFTLNKDDFTRCQGRLHNAARPRMIGFGKIDNKILYLVPGTSLLSHI
jgi:hypothetical protein